MATTEKLLYTISSKGKIFQHWSQNQEVWSPDSVAGFFIFFNHKTILPLCSAARSKISHQSNMGSDNPRKLGLQFHSAASFSEQQYWWLGPEVLLAAAPGM